MNNVHDQKWLESVNIACEIFNIVLFIIATILICVITYVIMKESPKEMGAYKWYMLFNSCAYYLAETIFITLGIIPMSPYKTQSGHMIYMYVAGGIFNFWHPSKTFVYAYDEFILFAIQTSAYSVGMNFVFRYVQTSGHRYCDFLSSRKAILAHIAILTVLTLVLVVPINVVTEEDEQEFLKYMQENQTSLYMFVKDGIFFGVGENHGFFLVDNAIIAVMAAICAAALCLSTFGTYRILNKNKGFLSENTYKMMRMLINALLVETITAGLIIFFPFGFTLLYDKFDTSLTAAAVKRICYMLPTVGLSISDVIKLIYVKNYRLFVIRVLKKMIPDKIQNSFFNNNTQVQPYPPPVLSRITIQQY